VTAVCPVSGRFNTILIGMSMCARGEFAFVVAATARAQGIIDSDTFSASLLAVLMSVIIAPALLRLTIQYRDRLENRAKIDGGATASEGGDQAAPLCILNALKSQRRSATRSGARHSRESNGPEHSLAAPPMGLRHPVYIQLNIKCRVRPAPLNGSNVRAHLAPERRLSRARLALGWRLTRARGSLPYSRGNGRENSRGGGSMD